ncbi:hypothetical protein DICVIV_03802, partial [Dictyocaulus viviparus]
MCFRREGDQCGKCWSIDCSRYRFPFRWRRICGYDNRPIGKAGRNTSWIYHWR